MQNPVPQSNWPEHVDTSEYCVLPNRAAIVGLSRFESKFGAGTEAVVGVVDST